MALPYFPLYPKDLLTDDRAAELTTEELGIWVLVLCRMWIAENELVDDDDRMSRILRISLDSWQGIKQRLVANGLLRVENGILTNNRLTYEFLRICNKSDQAKRAALIKAQKSHKQSTDLQPQLSGKEKLEADVERLKEKDKLIQTANA